MPRSVPSTAPCDVHERIRIPSGYQQTTLQGYESAAAFEAHIPPSSQYSYGVCSQVAFLPWKGRAEPSYRQFKRYKFIRPKTEAGYMEAGESSKDQLQFIERASTPLQHEMGERVYGTNRLQIGNNPKIDKQSVVSTKTVYGKFQPKTTSDAYSRSADYDHENTLDFNKAIHFTFRDKIDRKHRTFMRSTTKKYYGMVNSTGCLIRAHLMDIEVTDEKFSVIAASPELLLMMKQASPVS